MSEHTILLEWNRNTPDFDYDTYNRNHEIRFGAIGRVCGSASPEFHGDPQCLDPEQAFVMALASCHMLTFLAIVSKKGFVVDNYIDDALGELGRNQAGRMAITKVVLQPIVTFSGDKVPSEEEFTSLHNRAHSGCIIANSIASCVEVLVNPTRIVATKNVPANDFDEKAKTWDDNPATVLRAKTIADAIIKAVPIVPSFTAMEYGCGTGLLSFPLRDAFSRITLMDSSRGMIDVLKEKIIRTNVTNMDVVYADLFDPSVKIASRFSVIYSAMVLHHIIDIKKILSSWYSLLANPGYLCIADLDSDNGMFHGPEFTGHNGFDRQELQSTVEQAGFTDVRFETVFEMTKESRDGVVRSFPLFLMVGVKR